MEAIQVGRYSALGMQSLLEFVHGQPYQIKSSLGLEARHPRYVYEGIKMSINFRWKRAWG